jgi:hypothetical protein
MNQTPADQYVAHRYTDCANPLPNKAVVYLSYIILSNVLISAVHKFCQDINIAVRHILICYFLAFQYCDMTPESRNSGARGDVQC